MRLYITGHNNKYAIEQMLFTLYPGEKAEYVEGEPEGTYIKSSLKSGKVFTTATCTINNQNGKFTGRSSVKTSLITDKIMYDRYTQRIIKSAFYNAAIRSGIKKPVWGALTGVRPGKLMSELINSSGSDTMALKQFIKKYDTSPERASLCLETAKVSEAVKNSLNPKDICLYVGIPFCPTRCAYCSFVSQSTEKSMDLIDPFLETLFKEIHATSEVIKSCNCNIISVYFGGGTPTTLSAEQLDMLCTELENCFDLSNISEYTVEAGRPDTITTEKLIVLKKHGVTRVSVNPQTLSDTVLETIGRKHTVEDLYKALDCVKQQSCFDINMDLIAGLPADDLKSFKNTINEIININPENITVHTLALKKGSKITKEHINIPEAEEVALMLDYANKQLRAHGYLPYYLYRQKYMSGGFENIGWTKPNHTNIYNVCIMEELCSIIALGGGGSTKLIAPGLKKNIRVMDPKYPYEFVSHIDKICSDKGKIKEFYDGISTI